MLTQQQWKNLLPSILCLLIFSIFIMGCPPDIPVFNCPDCASADLSRCPGLKENEIEGQWIIRFSEATTSMDSLDVFQVVDIDSIVTDSSGFELYYGDTISLTVFLETNPVQFVNIQGKSKMIGTYNSLLDDLNDHFFDLTGSNRLTQEDVIPLKTCGCRMALLWVNPQKVDLNNSVTQASSSTRTQDDGTPGVITSVDINRKVSFGPGEDTAPPRPIGLSCDQVKGEREEDMRPCRTYPINTPVNEVIDPSNNVVVAVIDSGLDYVHDNINLRSAQGAPRSSVWINSGEVDPSRTGLPFSADKWADIMVPQPDDNCYYNDFIGYDFLLDTNLLIDRQGHGTHVGGTIATAMDVDPGVRIMPLKIAGYVDNNGQEEFTADLFSVLCAMEYAIEKEAAVINMSLGYYADSPNAQLRQLTKKAEDADVLIVASVGNDNMNIDCCQHWPSNLSDTCVNVISVGALGPLVTNIPIVLAPFSNYGELVNIAAPGTGVYGPASGTINGQIPKNGTSMAAAIVSRQAAILRNQASRPSAAATKNLLMTNNTGNIPTLCVKNGLYYDYTKYPSIWPFVQYSQ